jgi:hypothetical protein
MAISSAKPSITNKAGVYKPSIGYQKNIDINYNDGFKLKDSDIYTSYRNSLPATDGDATNSIVIGNYSNTKGTSVSKDSFLRSSKETIIEHERLATGKAIRNGDFNTITGKYNPEAIIDINPKSTAFDSSNNPSIYSPSFYTPQKPISPILFKNRIPDETALENNFNDLNNNWNFFTGPGDQYFLPPPEEYDTCPLGWVCIKDII